VGHVGLGGCGGVLGWGGGIRILFDIYIYIYTHIYSPWAKAGGQVKMDVAISSKIAKVPWENKRPNLARPSDCTVGGFILHCSPAYYLHGCGRSF
jgi:hypothetical protein